MNQPTKVMLRMQKQIDAWYAEQTDEVIKQKVEKLLDEKFEQILYAYLGISTKWGYVELVKEEPPKFYANSEIAKKIKEAALQYIDQVKVPELPKEKIMQIVKEVHKQVTRSVESSIHRSGTKIQQAIDTQVAQIIKEFDAQIILDTKALLTNES